MVAGLPAWERGHGDVRFPVPHGDADALATLKAMLKSGERHSGPMGVEDEVLPLARRTELHRQVRRLKWPRKGAGEW